MKYVLKFTFCSILASSLCLSGCTTTMVKDYSEKTHHENRTVLSDTIIAIGKPSQPIPQYPNAMLLAGKQYTLIVQPTASNTVPQDLFEKIFTKVDLSHFYLDMQGQFGNNQLNPSSQLPPNALDIKLPDNSSTINKVESDVPMVFIKPSAELKKGEQALLESLNFDCKTLDVNSQSTFICRQNVRASFSLAQKVQNIDNIKYALKQPLNVNFHYDKTSQRNSAKLLMPLALAVDVVTAPVQLIGGGAFLLMYSLAWSGAKI